MDASGGAELCMSIGPRRHTAWEGLISSALCTEDTGHSLWIDAKQSMIIASIILYHEWEFCFGINEGLHSYSLIISDSS